MMNGHVQHSPMSAINIVSTQSAPQAIGPYSQAVLVGDFLFCSGQIALDPSGAFVGEGDVIAQTKQALTNLAAVLVAGGSSPQSLVKITIYLKNMADFDDVNQIYETWLDGVFPARATVEVSNLPKNAMIEIDAIALVTRNHDSVASAVIDDSKR